VAKSKPEPVRLTERDWRKLAHAQRDMGEKTRTRILGLVGKHGELAATRGVAPVKRSK
jgi:hypothetical protein